MSCVSNGVIMSTCLSRMMRESIVSDISGGASGVGELDACGSGCVKSFASFWVVLNVLTPQIKVLGVELTAA